jgi:hypothetical protein
MIRYLSCITLAFMLHIVVSGCGHPSAMGESDKSQPAASIDTSKYLLSEEPDGAMGVIAAREEAKNNDEIVLVGRIGGRRDPWVDGCAAFMLIDASLSVVADGAMDGDSEVCLDDCCASQRAGGTTLVKVVDDHGRVLGIDARKLLDANENDMVVVSCRVNRDDETESFSVIADGVYVRR